MLHYTIHPDNPQERLLSKVAADLNKGAIAIVPTDCSYVICCQIGNKEAEGKIAAIKEYEDKHRLALLVSDLSMASQFAKIDNYAYKVMKSATPGPYTFILPATKDIPKRLLTKRKNVGIRIPNNNILLELLKIHDEPLYSSTLWLPDDDFPLFEPDQIAEQMSGQVDIFVDGGFGRPEVTTIISLVESGTLEVIREGAGEIDIF